MRAFITHSSDSEYDPMNVKEFSTIEDLIKFGEEQDHSLIISNPYSWREAWGPTPDFQIEVYDGWRE